MDIKKISDIQKLVTHNNCPDGMASAIIVYLALKDFSNIEIEPIFCDYSTEEYLNIEPERNMLFCDIIPPADRIEEFLKAESIVLDHHASAKPIVESFGKNGVWADEKLEPGVSGAVLAYKYIYVPLHGKNKYLEQFVRLVGIRDTWQSKDLDWENACALSYVLGFFPFSYWKTLINWDGNFDWNAQLLLGKQMYNVRINKAKKAAEDATIIKVPQIDRIVAVFPDNDRLTSDTSRLLFDNNEVSIAAGFYYTKSSICFSLRSDGTYDVSKLAATYGGGGHTKAAGFSIPKDNPLYNYNPYDMFLTCISIE